MIVLHTQLRLYEQQGTSSSSSSCRAASTDIPDLLSPLLPIMAGLQGYIAYPHIAAVCMFELVVLLLLGHKRGSMKRSFFQAAVVSILLNGCTTWTLTKRLEKKLDGNYTRMLRAILNKSWRQHPTRHQLYDHLPPITKTIQVRRTRHTGHCWRSRDEPISDVLLWTLTYGWALAGRPPTNKASLKYAIPQPYIYIYIY